MIITKQRLKEIIKEELEDLHETAGDDVLFRLTELVQILRNPNSLTRERMQAAIAEELATDLEEITKSIQNLLRDYRIV